jgi:hypothetical protein
MNKIPSTFDNVMYIKDHKSERFHLFKELAYDNNMSIQLLSDAELANFNKTRNKSHLSEIAYMINLLKITHDPHISSIIVYTYACAENAHISGVLRTIISERKLKRSEGNIMSGFNKSATKYQYQPYPSGDDTLEQTLDNIRAETTAKLEFGKNYINRWQMYNNLFKDRV